MQSLAIARRALESNIVPTKSGPLLVCGANHFHSFWVRDFSFCVPALLMLDKPELVKRHLSLCLDHIGDDGLLPRGFDVIDPKTRVLLGVFGIHASRIWPYTTKDLKPEFNGEHKTPAVDSNVLVLECCLRYQRHTGDRYFLNERGEQMRRAFEGILRLKKGDFLNQPLFSDWQDSARRQGSTFYLNILFYRLVKDLQKEGVDWARAVDADRWLERMWSSFYSEKHGLFLDIAPPADAPRFSLESILWAIEGDFFARFIAREKLYENLKASPLWRPFAGIPVTPEYPVTEISWTTKIVGLRHYHDGFFWSWLMGESLKVASLMGDRTEADRLFNEIERLTSEYQTVHEIYEMKSSRLAPVVRPLYRSESPFSWGSAKMIEGLLTYQKSFPN